MTRFNPDDPKWTAYVLGELNATDREAVEKELESSEEARNLVEDLRFAADLTKSELKDQAPLTYLTLEQRQTIRAAAGVERPRRWFGTRPTVWAACLATASIALLVAAVSSVVLHQRRVTPAAAIDSTIAEDLATPLKSERQSVPPSLAEAKKSEPPAPPRADRVIAPAAPVAAPAAAQAPPPPPLAATRAQDVIKDAAIPIPVPAEARAGAGAGIGPGVSADQKAQAVIPAGNAFAVSDAFAGKTAVLPALPGGRIFGTISDASAARIPGVDVNATNIQTGAVARAVTNETGAYILDGLQIGTYQVKAELPGFQTIVTSGVQVGAGSPAERDLTMQVAQMASSVEVKVAADTLASTASSGRGGGAKKDTTRLQSLAVVPPGSSFAPGVPITGVLGGVLLDSSVAANAASENAFLKTDQNPVSRFSADVNTASYDNVRRYLNQNQLPPRDVVGIEAMVNFFSYNYPRPSGNNPFGASIEAAPAPWNPQHRLVRIGIKAKDADGRREPSGKIVATDMKLEIEFNPAVVGEYRLIDDANPAVRAQLSNQRSNNNAQEAGGVEAGQTFTALYEIVPKALKNGSNQTLTVTVSYKAPNGVDSRQLVFPFIDRGQTFDRASTDFRFAAAVASFGMVLRNSQFKGTASIDSTLAIAEHSLGPDRNGQRHEFVQLVERARQLAAKRQ